MFDIKRINIFCQIRLSVIISIILLFLSINANAQNLKLSPFEYIFNNDFSKRDTGFFTNYTYSATDLTLEGNYTITSNPYSIYDALSPCTDHTPGADSLMMVVNGFVFERYIVWGDSIKNIIPNNDYLFSFWAQSCIYKDPARLEVLINGKKVPGLFALTNAVCQWDSAGFVWNSDTNKTAVITIIDTNLQASGNDFAIDDLSFKAVCSVQADAGPDLIICEGQTTRIGRVAPRGIPPFNYSWQPAVGLNNPNIATPTVNVNTSSTYYLTVSDSIGCFSYDTVSVTVIPFPQSKIVTNKPTIICPCDSVKMTAPFGDSYLWSTGDTTQSIFAKLPGKYRVNVNNQNLCSVDIDTQLVVLNLETATTIKIDTVYADVGDSILIPMHVITPVNSLCPLGQYTATVSFNKSILLPIGGTPIGTINGNNEVLNISGTAQGNLINNFEFVALLGNAECTDIKITQFNWGCDLIKIDTIYGRFCLKNLCKEPVPRLFDDKGKLYLSQTKPNPASDNIRVDFGLIEEGFTSMEIYDFYGKKILKLFADYLKPGEYSNEFDINSIESGAYIIKLQTPNNILYKTLRIIH